LAFDPGSFQHPWRAAVSGENDLFRELLAQPHQHGRPVFDQFDAVAFSQQLGS
jgi:hypothetical protein